jgi:hypothetical protein
MKIRLAQVIVAMVRLWCCLTYPRQTLSFRRKIGRWPNPAFPLWRNDKYAWRKIFDRNPLFTIVSDKLQAKQFASIHCRDIKVPRTLWTGSRAENIPDDVLAGDVVVKANHGSGWNIFVKDGEYARAVLNREANNWMDKRFGLRHAEWGYYGVEPALFVEEMLVEHGRPIVGEYKFYCGADKMAFAFVRQAGPYGLRIEGVLDDNGRPHVGTFDSGELSAAVHAPAEWQELRQAALTLSLHFDFVRCDLYLVNGDVHFSEFTLYTLGGFAWIDDAGLNALYTSIWDLRNSWFMQTPQTGWRKYYANALRVLLTEMDRDQSCA